MPIYLKQSTASQEIPLGYFVDSTDGNTEETALTIANTDIKLHKAGATTLANKTSGGATHISNGIYYAVLDATDTDTLGSLIVFCHPTGALAVRAECVVLAANVYDSMIGGGDTLDVQVTGIGANVITATSIAADAITDAKVAADVTIASVTGAVGSVTGAVGSVTGSVGSVAAGGITAASFGAGAIDAAAIAADAIGASELAADAVAELADAVWDEARAGHVAVGSFGQGVASVQGNVTGSVASVTGAVGSVAGNVDGSVGSVTGAVGSVTGAVGSVTGAVGSVTGNIGGNVTGSVGSLAAQAKTDVNAEVVDALATDTYAEPGQGAPAATATLAVKLGYLYKAWRNKTTQTATTLSVFADDTTTVDQKATVSDDATTFTKGEIATGP